MKSNGLTSPRAQTGELVFEAHIWLLTFPQFWFKRSKLTKENMEQVKTPYLLLCNHNAFSDFTVAPLPFFRTSLFYVVAIDGFIGREGLMRRVGCIGKRKLPTM